jgi:hypothetical protein
MPTPTFYGKRWSAISKLSKVTFVLIYLLASIESITSYTSSDSELSILSQLEHGIKKSQSSNSYFSAASSKVLCPTHVLRFGKPLDCLHI